MSEEDLQTKRSELLQSLQSSKPKHILQSLSFLTSLSSQSLMKRCPPSLPIHSAKQIDSDIEECLLPLKQILIDKAEKLAVLQNAIAVMPKKEYATIEAKCRALRA